MFDLLVLGSGVAGLSTAIRAARAGLTVLVITKGELSSSTTQYAQGGVAAALTTGDSPELHLTDTLVAGAGLCDPDAVRVLVSEGPDRVRDLMALGAVFDRTADGEAAALALAREGGHSLARIVHAGGDATGAEIERALVASVQALDAIEVRERCFTADLLVEGGRCVGVVALGPDGAAFEVRARHTVLATGGAGQMFAVTTNPALSTGDGVAMAMRAGAAVADLEFVQFHPTALHHPVMPRPLLSEALRGEGARLRDERGRAFMADEHPLGDLAPRDVVSRAITRRLLARGIEHVWLDATEIDGFAERFPTIWNACQAAGLDPTREWLPVAPAAHYLCGGLATDLDGASTLPGLWACGEVACSGVHGANRLASNSLLDGLVFGPRIVDAIERGRSGPSETGVLRGILGVPLGSTIADGDELGEVLTREALQQVMTVDAGVLRDATSLQHAAKLLVGPVAVRDIAGWELTNLVTVAHALVRAALARRESRGTHTRLDHLEASAALLGRFVHIGTAAPELVMLPAEVPA
ncbi:MAG: L-aspartate oxidase [Acidimicrobiia bacterium]